MTSKIEKVGNTDKQGFTKLIAKVFSFPEHNGKRQAASEISASYYNMTFILWPFFRKKTKVSQKVLCVVAARQSREYFTIYFFIERTLNLPKTPLKKS